MHSEPKSSTKKLFPLAVSISLAVLFLVLIFLGFFVLNPSSIPIESLRFDTLPKLAQLPLAVVWGVGGTVGLIYALNRMVELFSPRLYTKIVPFVFIGPVVVLLLWTLFIPLIRTAWFSLFSDSSAGGFVGIENYVEIFTTERTLTAIRNNVLWIVFGTIGTVITGLLVAVLADGKRAERIYKTIFFSPMAISLVGAGLIWGFVYESNPPGQAQIGLLNAIVTALGGEPQAWTRLIQPWNNLFLIVIIIWIQSGFAMVFFSAALRGVPQEIVEAATIDGASPITAFFKIKIPYIWPTVMAVVTTMVIFNLKVFDVVWTVTGANFDTQVLATEFFNSITFANRPGLGSAIATILLVLVVPVIIYNIVRFRRSEAERGQLR